MTTGETIIKETGQFYKDLALQYRAHDGFGAWDKLSDDEILKPFILDAEARRAIPIIGDPDPDVLWRLEVFYNTVALSIEKRIGVMVSPMMKMSRGCSPLTSCVRWRMSWIVGPAPRSWSQ